MYTWNIEIRKNKKPMPRNESFENAVEDIERRYGIVVDPNKKPVIEIEVDEHGRFWRRSGSVKWRVDAQGNSIDTKMQEERAEDERVQKIIDTVTDPEVRDILEEEWAIEEVGCTLVIIRLFNFTTTITIASYVSSLPP
jgi:hypothetical protein